MGGRGDSSHRKIYAAVARIPRGRVATYGQIARLCGLSGQARLVGYALSALPEKSRLAWYRVVNAEGRISGPDLQPGVYELTFHAGDYFRAAGTELPDPPFLDEVVIRFGIADPSGHYHVPLLLAPYSYSTYRGS